MEKRAWEEEFWREIESAQGKEKQTRVEKICLPADQNRKRRKEGASTGKYEEIGPILALPLSCGPEFAAPQPSVSAAAPGAGLQMREKCKEAILQLLSLPLHALCPAWC